MFKVEVAHFSDDLGYSGGGDYWTSTDEHDWEHLYLCTTKVEAEDRVLRMRHPGLSNAGAMKRTFATELAKVSNGNKCDPTIQAAIKADLETPLAAYLGPSILCCDEEELAMVLSGIMAMKRNPLNSAETRSEVFVNEKHVNTKLFGSATMSLIAYQIVRNMPLGVDRSMRDISDNDG